MKFVVATAFRFKLAHLESKKDERRVLCPGCAVYTGFSDGALCKEACVVTNSRSRHGARVTYLPLTCNCPSLRACTDMIGRNSESQEQYPRPLRYFDALTSPRNPATTCGTVTITVVVITSMRNSQGFLLKQGPEHVEPSILCAALAVLIRASIEGRRLIKLDDCVTVFMVQLIASQALDASCCITEKSKTRATARITCAISMASSSDTTMIVLRL